MKDAHHVYGSDISSAARIWPLKRFSLCSSISSSRVLHEMGCRPIPPSQHLNISVQHITGPWTMNSALIWSSWSPMSSNSNPIPKSYQRGQRDLMIVT